MGYISVKDAAFKFCISEQRVQKLCELQRIEGAKMISGVWVIPESASKPADERLSMTTDSSNFITLNELCEILSISTATGRNWIKLGKLTPDHMEKKTPLFTNEYVNKLKDDIQSGNNKALKSRRNKKYISGNALYNSYVSKKCQGIVELQKLLAIVEENKIELTEEVIQILVADCALHLLADKYRLNFKNQKNLLQKFLKKAISAGKYDSLIKDLILDEKAALDFCSSNVKLFGLNYQYEESEDVLGLIYISCKNIGNRKATGSYYTSTKVVKKLIGHLTIKEDEKVLDPCCGTGNFLLQLPSYVSVDNIYGNDIDKISVKITRLNIALKYADADIDMIYAHITEKNYLLDEKMERFEYIIGNPPWGYDFSDQETEYIRKIYKTAVGKNIESYDLFIEQGIKHLSDGGFLSFVLPEAVLNVKSHMPIRQFIMDNNSIKHLDFLGNAFDGVQCPSIILQLENTNATLSTHGMVVDDGKKIFTISMDREVNAEYFSFTTTDTEYNIIKKISELSNAEYLSENADFALGIVTGNNKDYISDVKTEQNEMVLKGEDICKYHINDSNRYIVFKPESFQQIAPTEMYRANEKLLYRFICRQLVFAYDDRQTLTLNSCNIVIPRIEGLKVKYILAVLNSRIAQFIYKKQYNSVKVLRSHIEGIPIPRIDEEKQNEIIQKVDSLIAGCKLEEAERLYNALDESIFDLFGLSIEEKNVVKNAVDGDNKFLVTSKIHDN